MPLMQSRFRSRTGFVQLACVAAAGVGIGLIAGFMFMSLVDTVLERGSGVPTPDQQLPGNSATLPEKLADVASSNVPGIAAAKTLPKASKTGSTNAAADKGSDIHTLCTSNGSPYLNYQTHIMYGTYQLMQKAAGGERHVAFTRILHRTQSDILMTQVPSFRADPLTPACDTWCEFPVSDRPNAVRQFFDAAQRDPSLIKAPWLLMIETDYVWMKPLQAPPAEDINTPSLAFPFSYINPMYPGIQEVMRKMFPADRGPLSSVPPSGPAPVMMRLQEWIKVMPDWERLTAHIEADPESKEKLGWVREMYAFSVATALQDIKLDLAKPPANTLITQPPADETLGQAAAFHYTWGTVFKNASGDKVWEFDKRVYTAAEIVTQPPLVPLPPPFDLQWKLQDGKAVTQSLYDTLTAMIKQINMAITNLAPLSATTA